VCFFDRPEFSPFKDLVYFFRKDWPKAPVETKPIVGWRLWEMLKGGLHPYVFTDKAIWPARQVMVAQHLDGATAHLCDHGRVCGCGLYAYKELRDALEMLREGSCHHPVGLWGYRTVIGEVYLWGWVAEHESGYRAEFGYPKSLYVGDEVDPVQILGLEEAYGVPVGLMADVVAA